MKAFWFGMTVHLWQTTLVLCGLVLVDKTLRRAPARLRDHIWSAGLVKLVLPVPVLSMLWPELPAAWAAIERESTIGPALTGLGRVTRPRVLTVSAPSTGSAPEHWLFVALTVVWVSGIAWLLATWMLKVRLSATRTRPRFSDRKAIPPKLRAAARDAHIPLERVHLTNLSTMPSVRRVVRWVVVVSCSVVESLSREELRGVLVHERTHARRGDVLRSALQDLAARVFFFYPPAWWLARRLKRGAELACDEAVVEAGVDPDVYARALAKTIRLGLRPAAAAVLGAGRSSLGERFDSLVEGRRCQLMIRHRVTAVLVFAFVLTMPLIPVSGATPWSGQSQDFAALTGSEQLISLSHQNRQVTRVLEDIAEQAGFELTVEGVPPDFEITIIVNNTMVREVLELLARDRGYVLTVIDPSTLGIRFIGPRAMRGPFRVGGDIREPEKIRHVTPGYPELAREARLEGIVILQVLVDTAGNVERVDVLRGLGLGLDVAAEEAVRQWRYAPTIHEGRAVEVIFTVTVQFELIG